MTMLSRVCYTQTEYAKEEQKHTDKSCHAKGDSPQHNTTNSLLHNPLATNKGSYRLLQITTTKNIHTCTYILELTLASTMTSI